MSFWSFWERRAFDDWANSVIFRIRPVLVDKLCAIPRQSRREIVGDVHTLTRGGVRGSYVELLSLRGFRRPYFLRPRASDLRGFVKQPSFENFYQHRSTMAPDLAQNRTNLGQGGGVGRGTRTSTCFLFFNANAKNHNKKKLVFWQVGRFPQNSEGSTAGRLQWYYEK